MAARRDVFKDDADRLFLRLLCELWRIRGTTYESVDLGRVMGSERDNASGLCMLSVFVGDADENAVPRGEREEALEDVEHEALL